MTGGALAGDAGNESLQCFGPTHCLAAGSLNSGLVSLTNDGGHHWSIAINGFESFGLACPTENDCLSPGLFRVGQTLVERTADGGRAWTPESLPTTEVPSAVWCSTPEDCFVSVGLPHTALFASRDGGQTWVQSPSTTGAGVVIRAVCPSATHCILAGRYLYTTFDNGAAWSHFSPRSNWIGAFTSVACADPLHCLAVGGNELVATSNGGLTWTPRSLTGLGSPSIIGLTCQLGTSICLASGVDESDSARGFIERSENAGLSWTLVSHQ